MHLVGHSIAGDEMTRFAGTYPQLLGELVYLGGGLYDRIEARQVEATFPKLPEPPSPLLSDLASPAALQRHLARASVPMPESEIRATRVFTRQGRFVRSVTPARISAAVANMVEDPAYEWDPRSSFGDLRASTDGGRTGPALPSPVRHRGSGNTRGARPHLRHLAGGCNGATAAFWSGGSYCSSR